MKCRAMVLGAVLVALAALPAFGQQKVTVTAGFTAVTSVPASPHPSKQREVENIPFFAQPLAPCDVVRTSAQLSVGSFSDLSPGAPVPSPKKKVATNVFPPAPLFK